MIAKALLKKIIGSRNDRVLKQIQKTVDQINGLETAFEALTDEQIQNKTDELRARLKKGESLSSILPEAFATVREASKRTLGMRHFDVQLVGGIVLHQGKIAEMKTGEGKTLVASLSLYLNALSGKGAHLVTVNDYLAQRDAADMGRIYSFLGMTTGVIVSGMEPEERQKSYACDITYGTNNEFGFDYLRDNMVFNESHKVQRPLNFAVVDEVDSILIDEARTPLIISGAAEDSSELYVALNAIIPELKLGKAGSEETPEEGDYYLEEKTKQAFLTEAGHQLIEKSLVKQGIIAEGETLYSAKNVTTMHFISAALRAHTLFHKDVDYMVKDNEVMIIDEHTGRAMVGRRWSDGLHQAIEAKEGVQIQAENQTLASITFQNYFRLYDNLSGMTGTADTEAYEFQEIYSLEVVVIPTNRPMVRKDQPDAILGTVKEKFEVIIEDVKKRTESQQPVLIGTASIEASEILSSMLKKAKIKHQVLNAKHHQKEASIIAQAGNLGSVTIATNMAGRGTDIILGGNWQAEIDQLKKPTDASIKKIKDTWQKRHDQVLDAGGLYIIGSERHESRRIDNQLRGRSGRQGDPGESRFYLSLEDNLVRIFASERMRAMMSKLAFGDGEPIESKLVSRSIATAQKKVENYNFDVRKQLLEYDNVANEQRKVIYHQRNELLKADDVTDVIKNIRDEVIYNVVETHIPPESMEEQWDLDGLNSALKHDFHLNLDVKKLIDETSDFDESQLQSQCITLLEDSYNEKTADLDPTNLHEYLKMVLLNTLDLHWRVHLNNLDHLRGSVNLRGYAQKDPKQEYKREAYELFESLLYEFKYETTSTIAKVQIEPQQTQTVPQAENFGHLNYQHSSISSLAEEEEQGSAHANELPSGTIKAGRNAPCPCGSGKKFKHCHGKLS